MNHDGAQRARTAFPRSAWEREVGSERSPVVAQMEQSGIWDVLAQASARATFAFVNLCAFSFGALIMYYAQKLILETDAQGHLLDIPELPPNARVEVIMLFLETKPTEPKNQRCPAPSLAGQVKIMGEMIAPAISEEEWEALK